jgi:hypothetical protein
MCACVPGRALGAGISLFSLRGLSESRGRIQALIPGGPSLNAGSGCICAVTQILPACLRWVIFIVLPDNSVPEI